jgi:periplasmic protein TonB
VSADYGDVYVPPGDHMPSSAKENDTHIAEAGRTVTPSTAGSSSGESQAARGVAASCEIPLEVHGSQKGGTQYHTVTPFHEETRTVIVFPHGCVLRLSTNVGVGQMLALTNQNTQAGMLARVTHVRAYPNLKSYVEVEFTQADPNFWSIDFAEEGAAQGYVPSQSPSAAPAATASDFWSSGTAETPVAGSVAPVASSRSGAKSGTPAVEIVPSYMPVTPPVIEPQSPVAQAAKPPAQTAKPNVQAAKPAAPKIEASKPSTVVPTSKATEFTLTPPPQQQEKAAEDASASQAWAEMLVMEPEQQLSAQQLSTSRSDVEESLAPDSSHEEDAHQAASDSSHEPISQPSFDPENPEPISSSVLKELEKLALEHVGEKQSAAPSVGGSDVHAAENSSTATKQRGASPAGKKQAESSKSQQSKDSRATKRSGLLSSFTGGGAARESKSSPLHSFTGGAPAAADSKHSPLHSFTPSPSSAESLPGVVEGTNPHKTQSLADVTPDAGEESDFGSFLRDPEPRGASQTVFAGHPESVAARPAELHATLTPLKAQKSKSGRVLAALVVVLALIVAWWFYPLHGSATPTNGAVPAASAPSPVNSPSQWPSQTPADAATLDASGGAHPAATDSGAATSAPAVESKPEADSGIREVVPVPRPAAKPLASSGQSQPENTRASMPTMTLAAPTSSSHSSANVSAEPPPDLSPADAAKARENSFPGIVGSSPESVPAPATATGPVVSGGRVKEPRLLSSVAPVYPQAAIQANVQGDVKVQATIDENGRVTKMHAISGPILLQHAAMEALRQWRYAPSVLNEKPIAVEEVITVRFKR